MIGARRPPSAALSRLIRGRQWKTVDLRPGTDSLENEVRRIAARNVATDRASFDQRMDVRDFNRTNRPGGKASDTTWHDEYRKPKDKLTRRRGSVRHWG